MFFLPVKHEGDSGSLTLTITPTRQTEQAEQEEEEDVVVWAVLLRPHTAWPHSEIVVTLSAKDMKAK